MNRLAEFARVGTTVMSCQVVRGSIEKLRQVGKTTWRREGKGRWEKKKTEG